MPRPQIALIGAGSMGSLHARVLAQSQRCDLAVVIDQSEQAARVVAEKWSVPWLAQPGSLTGVDAVIIASPTPTHRDLTLEMIAAGLPLLVEKPLCADLADTEKVLTEAENARVPIMCGFLERYNPAVLTAMSLIREPVHLTANRHSPYAPRIRTGVAWDLLVHDVDLALRCFAEEPDMVAGQFGFFHPASESDAEDVAEVVLGFGRRAVATASASRIGQHKIRSISIAEVERMVEIDLLRKTTTILRHVSNDVYDSDGRGYRQQTVMEIPELVTNAEPLATQLERFLDVIEGRVDADAERRTILPPHRVVARVAQNAPSPRAPRGGDQGRARG
jgi:predicted dehydrogenase